MTNDQRKQNYNTLRSIGFTKEEANRLKGGSEERIWQIVQQRESLVREIKETYTQKAKESGGLKYQSREEVQARRRENYKALRDAGYSPKEANSLKGAQSIKTQFLIDKKKGANIGTIHEHIKKELIKLGVKPDTARTMAKMPVDTLQRITVTKPPEKISAPSAHKVRGIQYEPVSVADKKYLSNYTYKISYQVKKENGEKETRWITVTSPDKMTKKAVKREARDILESGGGGGGSGNGSDNAYEDDGDILVSTIDIEEAYYNDIY